MEVGDSLVEVKAYDESEPVQCRAELYSEPLLCGGPELVLPVDKEEFTVGSFNNVENVKYLEEESSAASHISRSENLLNI